jgi:protein-disulfide isomerase
MTSSSDTPAGQPARGGIELLPLLMVGAVAVMLAIAGRIDRSAPVVEAQTTAAAETMSASPGESGAAANDTDATTIAAGPVSEAERTRIEGIVREYLLKNPEIMMQVQNALELKLEAQRTEQMTAALKENAQSLYKPTTSPFIGAAEPDVTVVEFFDYNCGFCRRAMPDIVKLTSGDAKLKFVFKEFPIFGKDSEAAARAAIAAKSQGKYWEMHKALFEHDGKLDEASALSVARGLGLDMEKLKADMALPETQKEIDETRQLAEKLGIQGTPHFFIGDQVIPGAPEDLYDQLQSKIADIRKSGCSVC